VYLDVYLCQLGDVHFALPRRLARLLQHGDSAKLTTNGFRVVHQSSGVFATSMALSMRCEAGMADGRSVVRRAATRPLATHS
jgi:hypothetical protein